MTTKQSAVQFVKEFISILESGDRKMLGGYYEEDAVLMWNFAFYLNRESIVEFLTVGIIYFVPRANLPLSTRTRPSIKHQIKSIESKPDPFGTGIKVEVNGKIVIGDSQPSSFSEVWVLSKADSELGFKMIIPAVRLEDLVN
ncbi:hypothetical protein DL93DRAFT_2151294 [Clavulina sp. PMI_390]|nr:hypothetical protein DL93DRAFT_2151294 [Clavulina sp. PMI_390]